MTQEPLPFYSLDELLELKKELAKAKQLNCEIELIEQCKKKLLTACPHPVAFRYREKYIEYRGSKHSIPRPVEISNRKCSICNTVLETSES
jgi:hypothetical protein